jgi:hypothetical protein
MEVKHLTDDQIQEYLSGSPLNKDYLETHINQCPKCMETLSMYKQMFLSFSEVPQPIIDFDMEVIMQQISREQVNTISEYLAKPVFAGIGAFVLMLLFVFIFINKYSANTQSAVTTTIIFVGISVGILLLIDLVNQYKRKYTEIFGKQLQQNI